MKKIWFLVLSLAFIAAFNSCSKKENSETGSASNGSSTIIEKTTPKGKYQIKSGIIRQTTKQNLIDVPFEQVIYFDDYGNKERIESRMEMEMMNQKIVSENVDITVDGYIYKLDMEKKTGTKSKLYGTPKNEYDFSSMAESAAKQFNLVKKPDAVIAGKTCESYEFNNEKYHMKGVVCNYKGISLKSKVSVRGMEVEVEVSKLEENVSIPSDKFDIPKDFTITEF